MRISSFPIATVLMMGLLSSGQALADHSPSHAPYGQGSDNKLPNGIVGISLIIGAERIGEPAVLYVGMVHPEGPAHKAGLRHGDEVVSVDGTPVRGKSYEQVVGLIRGEAETAVKVGVKSENGLRELSITRVAGEKLKQPAEPHERPK